MSFQDKSIQCADCGVTVTFTATEQEFFQSKGYANKPKRRLSRPTRDNQATVAVSCQALTGG